MQREDPEESLIELSLFRSMSIVIDSNPNPKVKSELRVKSVEVLTELILSYAHDVCRDENKSDTITTKSQRNNRLSVCHRDVLIELRFEDENELIVDDERRCESV